MQGKNYLDLLRKAFRDYALTRSRVRVQLIILERKTLKSLNSLSIKDFKMLIHTVHLIQKTVH